MRRIFFSIAAVVFFTARIYSQQFSFAWITDIHVGSKEANENAVRVVSDVNSKNFSFAIVSGDITGAGSNRDLDTAKSYLDRLKIRYNIIPGNHDTKRSESGCMKFISLWGSEEFVFENNGIVFIGLNSAVYYRGHGGHLSPESLAKLEKTLAGIDKDKPVIIVLHHLMSNMLDNWFELTNLLEGYNVLALLCGHGHANAISRLCGLPVVMARATLNNKNGWGYCSVTVTKDSLLFFEENGAEVRTKLYSVPVNKKNIVAHTDSLSFVNYNTETAANINLKKTLISGISASNGFIGAAAADGTIICFDYDGSELWRYKTDDRFIGTPAIAGGSLVAGSVQGNLYSFDCRTGKLRAKKTVGEIITSRLTSGEVTIKNEKIPAVFAGSSFGVMQCVAPSTLDIIWKNNDAAGLIECEPLLAEGKIIYGAWDTYLNCCDASSGRIIWRWQADNKPYFSPAACKPVTDGRNVFIAAPDNFVSSVNLLNGNTVWRTSAAPCWESVGISLNGKRLYVKGAAGKLFRLEAGSGKLIDSVKFQNGSETMSSEIIEINGRAVFTTQNGMVFSCGEEMKLEPLLFLGASRAHKVIKLKNNLFAVSNMDGRIVLFKLKNEGK